MQPSVRHALCHGTTSFFFALGMGLTLLGAAGLTAFASTLVLTLLAVTTVLTIAGMSRLAGWIAGGVTLGAAALWLLCGGAGTLMEVGNALVLHMNGLTTALPYVASETVLIAAALCAVASYFVTQRSAGAYPSLIILLLAVVLVWLGDRCDVLWFLLPSVVVSVAQLMIADHEELSIFRVLPLSLVTVLLAFGGVAVGGASIPPLKEAADNLRQRIYDTFFFTAPRDVFSLADLGYYPQGQTQLGGPAEPAEHRVMVVNTPRKVYLRGAIKNRYTGRTWLDDTGGRRYLWNASRWQKEREAAFNLTLPAAGESPATHRISVRMLAPSASSLFVPQRLRTMDTPTDIVPYFNAGSELFATRNLQLGDHWQMEAALLRAGDAGVMEQVAECASLHDANLAYVNQNYRGLPDHMEQVVYDLAWEAAGNTDDPYQQALNIQNWLQSHYRYTLDAPEQNPDMDFVTTFLLLGKEGYCTYFASAMTVMCRMVGLPARYVEGFVATPDASGMAIVTGQEGHAWTEVYFRGYGWLTFDATPGSISYVPMQAQPEPASEGDATPTPGPDAPATPTPSPSPTPSPTPAPDGDDAPPPEETPTPTPPPDAPTPPPEDEPPQDKPNLWWLWLLLAAIAGAAARIGLTLPQVQSARRSTAFGQWLAWIQASHDALRMMDLRRHPCETPSAFFRRVGDSGKLPFSLKPLQEAENVMFYGHAEPTEEEIRTASDFYRQLEALLPPVRRVRLVLERAFLPARVHDITR